MRISEQEKNDNEKIINETDNQIETLRHNSMKFKNNQFKLEKRQAKELLKVKKENDLIDRISSSLI